MSRNMIVIMLALCVCVSAAGCDGTKSEKGEKPVNETAAGKAEEKAGSAGEAVAAAQKAVAPKADDAIAMSVGTGGAVLTPPPKSWQVLFASPGKKKLYRVMVEHGKAGAPEELADLPSEGIDLGSAVPYSDMKIGSDEAYELGRKFVADKGEVPPQAVMGLSLVATTGLVKSAPGIWTIAFTHGTSTEGMIQVTVDAMTGEVRESKS